MPFQEINGVHLYYEDEAAHAGAGIPVLLLHGAFNTARGQFSLMVERLCERGYRVIAPDLRGYGRSRPPQRDYPPGFYGRDMEDVAALLGALLTRPAHVVGVGDGGVVGLLLAIAYPDRVYSLVCWAANADWPAEERGLYEHLRDAIHSPDLADLMRERHGTTRAEAQAMQLDYVQASLDLTDGKWDAGLAGNLTKIRCPVLLGAGSHTDFLPLGHAGRLTRQISRGELWIQPHVGHFWPMTQEGAEVFVGRVLNWLVQNEG